MGKKEDYEVVEREVVHVCFCIMDQLKKRGWDFTLYSNKEYARHGYEIAVMDENKSLVCSRFESVRELEQYLRGLCEGEIRLKKAGYKKI